MAARTPKKKPTASKKPKRISAAKAKTMTVEHYVAKAAKRKAKFDAKTPRQKSRQIAKYS